MVNLARNRVVNISITYNHEFYSPFFEHHFQTGEKFATIFSRTIATTGPEIQPVVFRASGTGHYTVTKATEQQTDFNTVFRYDGQPDDNSKTSIRDFGKTVIYNDKSSTNTDGSGLVYNALIWGTPPPLVKVGQSWSVNIEQPWELGGKGQQRVEVITIDAATQTIKLKREGDGKGPFDGDRREMDVVIAGQKIRAQIYAGNCHWIGYTTFKSGIVISDELLVTRPLTLSYEKTQLLVNQRQYILLNQMAE